MSQDQYLIYATSESGGAGYFETKVPTNSTNSLAALHVDATGGTGIEVHSKRGIGVNAITDTVDSLGGVSAIYGRCTGGYAGVFEGQVDVRGKLTKSIDQFKID